MNADNISTDTTDATDTDRPTLSKIVRKNGIGGFYTLTVIATYPGARPSAVTFMSDNYGGPVVMITQAAPNGVYVSDPGRFGEFGEDWVRAFFA